LVPWGEWRFGKVGARGQRFLWWLGLPNIGGRARMIGLPGMAWKLGVSRRAWKPALSVSLGSNPMMPITRAMSLKSYLAHVAKSSEKCTFRKIE